MLELKNVRKIYNTKAGVVNALDGVSLVFPATGLIFVTGKSGSGKTTLLNIIGGLDGIDEGEICIQDKNFSTFSTKEYDSYRNSVLGFVFQEYNLLEEYTVEYNIKIAMELQGLSASDEEIESLLREFELEGMRNRKPSELSGGQQQRVAIARALVKRPRIIMADEPTGALDSATGGQVLDTLKRLSKDKLVIVVSHDNEFAEKYADRIIRLKDGKVVEDISFTEKELPYNVSDLGSVVIVKSGSTLSGAEKDVLAKAVLDEKPIELTKKLCFRDKTATGEVTVEKTEPITFKNSKMRLKSSAYLGWKSLRVKPIRLLITVLISAFAFAIFGLFDAVANFTVHKSLLRQLKNTSSTVVATANYIVDNQQNEKYNIKLSDEALNELSAKTGGKVKGFYDLRSNKNGRIFYTQTINELTQSKVTVGKDYYTKTINGFIEFDKATEIDADGTFKDFSYRLVLGDYPTLRYNNNVLEEDSLYEVAISVYLANSIIHYLDGTTLNDVAIQTHEDLLGQTVSIDDTDYKIVGIIDCGDIPDTYDVLESKAKHNVELTTLIDDFNVFINSSAQKCFFVADGCRKALKEKNNTDVIYYAGDSERILSLTDSSQSVITTDYVYNVANYSDDNVLLFSGEYAPNGTVTLADDEVLINYSNLTTLFKKELVELQSETDRQNVRSIFATFENGKKETVRPDFHSALRILGKEKATPFNVTILSKTDKNFAKQVKIVGFYFGVDVTSTTPSTQFKLMMNTTLMSELSIYPKQGEYTHVLFSLQSVKKGSKQIVKDFMSKSGLALVWYQNSALAVIQANEPIIRQASDLFLYASLALAIFSIFMLYNYISVSITNKHRSVGVLRGLGAGGKDILLTFLFESLFIGFINGVFANILCVFGGTLVNSYIMNVMHIPVSFILFEIRQVLIIFGVSLLTAILSSVLPIIKISKKKPVALIRKKY